jgi:hypothetical protein
MKKGLVSIISVSMYVPELHEGHDGAEDLILRDFHVLLLNPSRSACVSDLPLFLIAIIYVFSMCRARRAYRDIDKDGGLNVVPFVGGGLAAGEQGGSLALAMLNVL